MYNVSFKLHYTLQFNQPNIKKQTRHSMAQTYENKLLHGFAHYIWKCKTIHETPTNTNLVTNILQKLKKTQIIVPKTSTSKQQGDL